jgi:hypothetical protein
MQGLTALGKIVGIAGIGFGIVFLLFRQYAVGLLKKIDAKNAPRMMLILVAATWSIGILGLIAWAAIPAPGDRDCIAGGITTTGPGSPVVACTGGNVTVGR